jgi:hypothetical protein
MPVKVGSLLLNYAQIVCLPSGVQKDKRQGRLYKENYNFLKNDVDMRQRSYH